MSLILHYSCYLTAVLFFKPEDEVAIGIKEPIGPCDEFSDVHTAFGMVSYLEGRIFLALTVRMVFRFS